MKPQDVVTTKAGHHLIDPGGDFLTTLKNCGGHYVCSIAGEIVGPIVAHTGEYEVGNGTKKRLVGLEYFNFSRADQWPAVLTFFAKEMVRRLTAKGITPDVIVGASWAGVGFSRELARLMGCRHVSAAKEVTFVDGKRVEKITFGRYEGGINPGDIVVVSKELVNSSGTTGKLVRLIEEHRSYVAAITCAINRSFPLKDSFLISEDLGRIPIIGVVDYPTLQYRQDHPVVIEAVALGNVVWEPLDNWDQIITRMEDERYRLNREAVAQDL